MEDFETIKNDNNVFFQKKQNSYNEYRVISSHSLTKSTNIIDIVRNNALFDLIYQLNSDLIIEYKNKNNIIKYVFSSDIMKEFGDSFALKISNSVNVISDNDCIITGASVPYNNNKYSNIFFLNNLNIVFNISNNTFNVIFSYNIDNNKFNNREIELVSNFLTKIVSKLNAYVCN